MRFRNPANGHIETVSHPILWTFLFGCFYFAYKGLWMHAAFSLVIAILTSAISWFIYPFFAPGIMRNHYLRNGWILVDDDKGLAGNSATASAADASTKFHSQSAERIRESTTTRTEETPIFGSRREQPLPRSPESSAGWTGVLYWGALAFCALIFLGAVAQIIDPESARARRSQNEKVVALNTAELAIVGKNTAHALLFNKRPSEQAHFLGTAVEYVGDKCTGEKAFFMGFSSDNSAFWSVGCSNGDEYVVQIFADAGGSSRVLDCGVLKLVSGVECFKKLSAQ